MAAAGAGIARRDAAIWRKIRAIVWCRIPELSEDCLSFVMPQQHGARVAEIGDGS